jgi:hypothetical protein
MLDLTYSVQQGLFYGAAITGYLLLIMVTVNPRMWGYSDYPERVKSKVRPPTKEEMRWVWLLAAPYFLFMPLYPVYSVLQLKALTGGTIAFMDAFTHLLVLAAAATFGDLVILDWLIVSKITPSFVVIEGSEPADYKDFSNHYVGHTYASVIIVGICAAVAYAVSVL